MRPSRSGVLHRTKASARIAGLHRHYLRMKDAALIGNPICHGAIDAVHGARAMREHGATAFEKTTTRW